MFWPHTKTLDVYNKETSKIFFAHGMGFYELSLPPSFKTRLLVAT